jgi:hypothetical protein
MTGEMEKFDGFFGLCPICHKMSGFANAGRSHRAYCKEHKKSWFIGANLFSSWRQQTKDEQRKIWDGIGLNEFEDVQPYFYPREDSQRTFEIDDNSEGPLPF